MSSRKDTNGFVPKYRNDSHPWLIKAPGYEDADGLSVCRKTYAPPERCKGRAKGPRREVLERFYWLQVATDLMKDDEIPEKIIEDYKSEYNCSFDDPEFTPAISKFDPDSELHKKYPLYGDGAMTYWQEYKGNGTRQPLRKKCNFTKAMSEGRDG